MGGQISPQEVERRRLQQQQRQAEDNKRATELATEIVRHLNSTVIRPGPKPEERECTQVATELEAEIPALAAMICQEL